MSENARDHKCGGAKTKSDVRVRSVATFRKFIGGDRESAGGLWIGVQSPVLNRHDKGVLTQLLGGHADVAFPANKQISVKADDIVCNAGNVDITAHSCKLTFGGKTADLTGDKAHELYATMAEAGVPPEGSAGAVHESLSHLVCTINPHEIAQKDGGGADCTFDAQASPAFRKMIKLDHLVRAGNRV